MDDRRSDVCDTGNLDDGVPFRDQQRLPFHFWKRRNRRRDVDGVAEFGGVGAAPRREAESGVVGTGREFFGVDGDTHGIGNEGPAGLGQCALANASLEPGGVQHIQLVGGLFRSAGDLDEAGVEGGSALNDAEFEFFGVDAEYGGRGDAQGFGCHSAEAAVCDFDGDTELA